MDWMPIASEAILRYRHQVAKDRRARRGQFRRWLESLRQKRSGTQSASQGRRPGYYVDISDWPTSRAETDLPPERVLAALQGLSDYYHVAMKTLSEMPEGHGLSTAADGEVSGEADG